jgi:hypothetical protein
MIHQPPPNSMKVTFRSLHLKIAFSIATLAFCLVGSTYALPPDSSLLSPGPVRPSGLDYRTEVLQGYLEVYSATDEFDDGGVSYHAHSSYAIYTTDGEIFKNVENHITRSDELPEIVALPVGSYIVEARSNRAGYVRLVVAIKAGRRTTLDLELGQQDALVRLARTSHS